MQVERENSPLEGPRPLPTEAAAAAEEAAAAEAAAAEAAAAEAAAAAESRRRRRGPPQPRPPPRKPPPRQKQPAAEAPAAAEAAAAEATEAAIREFVEGAADAASEPADAAALRRSTLPPRLATDAASDAAGVTGILQPTQTPKPPPGGSNPLTEPSDTARRPRPLLRPRKPAMPRCRRSSLPKGLGLRTQAISRAQRRDNILSDGTHRGDSCPLKAAQRKTPAAAGRGPVPQATHGARLRRVSTLIYKRESPRY